MDATDRRISEAIQRMYAAVDALAFLCGIYPPRALSILERVPVKEAHAQDRS